MYTGPDPETTTEDGRYIHAYPKVPYPSDAPALTTEGTIIVQEKLDGGNFRVLLDESGERVYASKKTIRGTDPDEMNAFFRRPAAYIAKTVSTEKQQAVVDEYGTLTLFGELMLYHSISYDWDATDPFLVFDVWKHEDETFASLTEAKEIASRLGLNFVPIVAELAINEFQQYIDDDEVSYPIPESQYRAGKAEGVVFKNYDTQTFAKYVSPEFKEINNLRWGFTQKDAETGEGLKKVDYTKWIVAKYVTDTRIEKQLRKVVMDAGALSMELMPDLMDAVYEDIWAEHGEEIIYSGQTVDMGRLHDLVADRCRHRLRAIVENRELIEEVEGGELSTNEYLDLLVIGLDK